MMFLEDLTLTGGLTEGFGAIISTILYFLFAIILIVFVFAIANYIYTSLAFMAIGKKAKDEKYWLAWIPFIGKPLLASRIANMPWWPVLLLLGYFFTFIPAFGTYLFYASLTIFGIFDLIWMWKTFKAVGKPGWWILLVLIPIFGWVIYYILLGVAAWSHEEISQ